jgi:ABC-2 type transport system permease protein
MIRLMLIRMKLIVHNRFNLCVLLVSIGVFLLIVNSLSLGAKERSNIPIGLLNLDESDTAQQLVENIKAVPALYVYETKEEGALKKLLSDEEILTYFVIQKGYETAIKSGKLNELIKMYYLENNNSVKVISDIFAGEMLYKICLYKGVNIYKKLPINKNSFEVEYQQYADSIKNSTDFDFTFDISLIDFSNNMLKHKEIENTLLYQQIIMGILGMLLGFIAMFISSGTIIDKENGIDKRIRISSIHARAMDMSQLLIQMLLLGFLSILFTGILYYRFQLHYKQLVWIYFLILIFSLLYGFWFMILGKLLQQVGKYQTLGIFSIFFFGLMGYLYLFRGFLNLKLLNILKFVPNSWFIHGFTDIILNDFSKMKYYLLTQVIIMVIILFIINEFIGRRQRR